MGLENRAVALIDAAFSASLALIWRVRLGQPCSGGAGLGKEGCAEAAQVAAGSLLGGGSSLTHSRESIGKMMGTKEK